MSITTNASRETLVNKARLTQAQKNSNSKQWYKDYCDKLVTMSTFASGSSITEDWGQNTLRSKKINYDLFNNKLTDMSKFNYIVNPFGGVDGELPANFVNRDIVSGKIKVLLGTEMKMPFSWRVVATNEEATTERETEEFNRIVSFVTDSVLAPLREQITQEKLAGEKGRELSEEEKKQIQAEIQKELESKTPDSVRRYITREYQTPVEVMHNQLLKYLIKKLKLPNCFNEGFKHLNLGGAEVYRINISRGEPTFTPVNVINFKCDDSPDIKYVEDGAWAVYERFLSPIQVITEYGEDLSDKEVDRIMDMDVSRGGGQNLLDATFTFDDTSYRGEFTVPVVHTVWKSLQKVGFLTYMTEDGTPQSMLVEDDYVFSEEMGDISIEWSWIPEVYEATRILGDIYVNCRPFPGQNKDLDCLYEAKLPYYGAIVDNMNSAPTAIMDRMAPYQYYYNVILYRIELLMASDKGRILAANIKAVPKSAGIDVEKFMYFMEANKLAWFNPKEEGNRSVGDITNMVKEIDMSLASDIAKYIELAEFIERKCGASVGIPPSMEAQIGPNEAVQNTQQSLIQSSHILQPYFELHNTIKGNALQGLLEVAKVAYGQGNPRKLSYSLDDLSVELLTIDPGKLNATTVGVFMSNSMKAEDAKRTILGLAQAAMQNQQIDLVDVIKIIKADDIREAEESLLIGREKQREEQTAIEEAQRQHEKEIQMQLDERERRKMAHEKDMIVLKEEERRKTELQKQAMLSIGFNEDKDLDNDGVPDVLEIYKHGVDTNIRERELEQEQEKLKLERDKFNHQKENDKEKNKLEQKKILQAKRGKS